MDARSFKCAGISARDAQHQCAERGVTHLYQGMQVIRHVAIGVQACVEASDNFGDDLIQQVSISGREEYALPMVSPQRDVIHRTGDMNTKRSRHPCLLLRSWKRSRC